MRIRETGNDGLDAELCPVQKYLVPDLAVTTRWLETVEVTEELFIPGYPENLHDRVGIQPVWKRATIASSVQKGWNGQRKFLIDSASKRGMSGSPVLYYNPRGIVRIMGMSHHFSKGAAILTGIYVGRIGVAEGEDPQVGTVWHQSVIDEIIDGRCPERLPEDIEVSGPELEEAIRGELIGCSRERLANILNPNTPSRLYVSESILSKIRGRASRSRVIDVLLSMAEAYDEPLVAGD